MLAVCACFMCNILENENKSLQDLKSATFMLEFYGVLRLRLAFSSINGLAQHHDFCIAPYKGSSRPYESEQCY